MFGESLINVTHISRVTITTTTNIINNQSNNNNIIIVIERYSNFTSFHSINPARVRCFSNKRNFGRF